MKFTRRTESMSSARAIFKRARADSRCGYEVYIAAAMTEYYCSKVSDPCVPKNHFRFPYPEIEYEKNRK